MGRIGAKNLRFPGQETTTGRSWPRAISDGGLTGAKLGRAAIAAQRVPSGARFADLHEDPETKARPKWWPTRWNKAPTAPNRTSHNRPKARHRCAPPTTPSPSPQTERSKPEPTTILRHSRESGYPEPGAQWRLRERAIHVRTDDNCGDSDYTSDAPYQALMLPIPLLQLASRQILKRQPQIVDAQGPESGNLLALPRHVIRVTGGL